MSASLPTLRGLPLVGCLPELRRDRLGFLLRAFREGGDVVRVPALPGRYIYVITAPDAARDVLVKEAKAFKKFVALSTYSRPVLGDGLVTSEGDLHRRQRKLIAPGLSRRQIAGYAATMARHVDAMLAGWTDGLRFPDVHAEMTRLTLSIATETMFSAASAEYAAAAGAAVHAATDYIAGEVGRLVHLPWSWPLPRNRRIRRAVGALDRMVYGIIAERRARPAGDDGPDDILAMLLAARDEDDGRVMTDQQVRDEVMTLFVAGHETTANALSWSLLLLAQHPEIAERLAAESRAVLDGRPPTPADLPRLPLAEQVFKEAMRLYPPAYMLGRETLAPVTVGGHALPTGVTVLISVYGLHRRPDLFEDPERFDPDRFTPEREAALPRGAYVPFADGPRVCIGNRFALMEAQIVLAHIAQHVRLTAPSGLQVTPLPRVTLRPGAAIPLTISRRG